MRASGDEFRDVPSDRREVEDSRERWENRSEAERARLAHARTPAAAPQRARWPIPLAVLGLLGLALAAILAGVANGRRQLPDNYTSTRNLTGAASVLWNTQALRNGDSANAVQTNVPLTGQQIVKVTDTSGNTAKATDATTLNANGQQFASTDYTYAVDRNTLGPVPNPPGDWNVNNQQGLTSVAFPVNTGKQDYSAWVPDTQSSTPLHFVREENRGGVNTFVYQTQPSPAPLTDPTVLQGLPSTLPKSTLAQLLPRVGLSADQQAALTQALPTMPDPVPLNYLSQVGTTYWVEPTTGNIVDSQQQVTRAAAVGGTNGTNLPNLPVLDANSRYTDQTVASLGQSALDRHNSLNTAGHTWPWVLGVLGAIALLAGLLGMLARRRPQQMPAHVSDRREPPTDRRRPMVNEPRRTRVEPPKHPADSSDTNASMGNPQPPYTGLSPHLGTDEEQARTSQHRGKRPPDRR